MCCEFKGITASIETLGFCLLFLAVLLIGQGLSKGVRKR